MFRLFFIVAVAFVAATDSTHAALTTSPYLFTEQSAFATGQFEWDEFSNPATGPHTSDVRSVGTGSSTLSTSTGFVTGTQNIYSLGSAVDFSIALSGLDAFAAITTIVLQISATDAIDVSSVLLDGIVPNTLVDRGVATGVLHNTDNGTGGAPFDTHYYWAEWQVTAQTEYSISYSTPEGHVSLAQVKVDYFNAPSPFAAVAAAQVPEPETLSLLSLTAVVSTAIRLRR